MFICSPLSRRTEIKFYEKGRERAFEDLENVFSVFCFLSWKILNVYKRRGDYIMNPHVCLTQLQQAVPATFALAPGIDCRQRLSHGEASLRLQAPHIA